MNFGTLKMFCVAFRDVNFLSSLNDSFVFAKIIWTLFFYIGITAGSHHFAPKCRPIITLEDIVVSSVENTTMEKSLLGHYTNIFSCELDCCQRRNCDLVLFDGKLCYGAFCSAENTCHFQSAKGEQTSYRAVFMNNILKENVTPNVTVNSLQITVPRSNGIDLSKNYKESNFSKHLSKLKLATKKKRFDGVSSNGKLRTNSTRYGQSCNINKIQQNVTLDSGTKAGIFKMHGKSRNIDQCAALCCKDKLCDLAVVMTGRCYTVQCFSEEDCDSRKTPSSDVIVAYKKRHWKNRADQKFKKKERGHEKISKKTVVPKSSQGNIGEILDSIRFLNGPSTVTSDMKFTFLRQCALYVEPENFTKTMHGWVTPRYTPVKYLYQAPDGISPPLGIRSAVPLGGMGTGSLELRADGSFHEWTLENQSPGGSVKLGPGALDKAVLGVRVSSLLGTKAAILRTHPPPGYPGVKSLSYSGLFPVSKLTVNDNRFFGVQMDLFAYGILHPRKTDSSFVPGLAFTLSVKNPTQKPLNVSFLLNMPLGEQPDTSRDGSNFNTVEDVESSAQCAVMCNEDKRCMAWSYERNTCYLKDSMPLHAYRTGVTSGVKGRWHTNSRDSLTCKRPGNFPNSGSTTIMSINTNKPSFAVTDDFRSVWDAFDQTGRLRKRIEDAGFHGTIAVSAKLPAGTSETLTFILAWYYPNRDHAGQAVGQFYRKLFNSSIDVANHLRDTLITDLRDVVSWQSNIVPPNSFSGLASQDHVVESSLPDWLQDHLVNSLSFWRSGFRVADGRWRQWEALDCNDVDSVHNDFQRELPYLLFFPELLENVVRAWAEHQHPEGWIQETLGLQWGCHNRTNRLDTAGGRVMADVTPAFLAQLYHLYLWTGNANLLQDLWPAARKALIWLMRDSTGGTGLPLRKTCTYDIIYLEGYDYTTYNSVMYLLGLKVGKVLAEALGEQQLASTIHLAFDHGKAKIDRILWNEQDGFYHSWWDHKKGSPDWLMADSLYGQVWAYALGLGDLLDPEKMKRHLQKERELNDTPYGLRVLTQGKTKGLVESIIPRARHKRRINEADAVAHLDSFFSEVYGLQKKSNVAKKLIRMKNVTDKKSLGTPASSHRKLMASSFEEITRNRTKEDYVRRKDSNKTKTNSYKHMETINKWNQSTRTKMRPLTQEFLNHKNCFALEKESKFNSIWMGSDSDWSTLSIHLGMDPVKSLKQAEKALEHYRTTLNDLWNIHGLTAGQGYGVDGQPWCTSHYSFHLVLWHIPLALSGQRYDAVQQKLTFEPKLKVPYALPFFTPYASGIVKARQLNSGSVKYTVILTSGKLDINLLAVSRSMLPRNRVSLARGEYISWERK